MQAPGNSSCVTAMRLFFWFALFSCALFGPAAVTQAEETAYGKGLRLAETNCTRCHAIGVSGASPFAPAPPFREVAKNYTQEELIDGFMEGLAVRHQAMPDWEMTMDQAEAIAAYIMALGGNAGAKTGDSPAVAGYEILVKNCARCHAIEAMGDSPMATALPLREIAKRYEPVYLDDVLTTAIPAKHEQLPQFNFTRDQIAAMADYLSALNAE